MKKNTNHNTHGNCTSIQPYVRLFINGKKYAAKTGYGAWRVVETNGKDRKRHYAEYDQLPEIFHTTALIPLYEIDYMAPDLGDDLQTIQWPL